MSSSERTGWRDKSLSIRHRAWGFNCPGVDLDFLLVEYSLGVPVALVEYKHFKAQEPNLDHATYRALINLADGYGPQSLPFLIARYWPDTWAFRVTPVNARAQDFYLFDSADRTEREFVADLYAMRALTITDVVLRNLKTVRPPA